MEEDDEQQVEMAVARPNWERADVWAGFDISLMLSPLLVGSWVRGWTGSASVVFLNFGLGRLAFFLSLYLSSPPPWCAPISWASLGIRSCILSTCLRMWDSVLGVLGFGCPCLC